MAVDAGVCVAADVDENVICTPGSKERNNALLCSICCSVGTAAMPVLLLACSAVEAGNRVSGVATDKPMDAVGAVVLEGSWFSHWLCPDSGKSGSGDGVHKLSVKPAGGKPGGSSMLRVVAGGRAGGWLCSDGFTPPNVEKREDWCHVGARGAAGAAVLMDAALSKSSTLSRPKLNGSERVLPAGGSSTSPSIVWSKGSPSPKWLKSLARLSTGPIPRLDGTVEDTVDGGDVVAAG